MLRLYRDALPDVAVELRQHDFGDTSAGLRTGDSDVALIHLPIAADGLELLTVAREERVAMIASDDPLATQASVTVATA